MRKIDVLDKGYVAIHEDGVMGSDKTIANAARVSYQKRSEVFSVGDERLIKFLAREGHTSPFRHAVMQFETRVPLMIARQWYKYCVGAGFQDAMFAWNESSRRYITEDNEYYSSMKFKFKGLKYRILDLCDKFKRWINRTPEYIDISENERLYYTEMEFRSKPANSKQGSGAPLEIDKQLYWSRKLRDFQEQGESLYQQAISDNMAPEQARLFTASYGLYVSYYWTASVQAVAHLIQQRTKADAQKEFQDYAQAIQELALEQFPIALNALLKK